MENMEEFNKHYKARKLSVWQKMMQAAWFKRYYLDEFECKDGIIKITTQGGKSICAPLAVLKVRFQKDTYDRRECRLQHGNDKLFFQEIPGMLEEEEWDTLFAILESAGDAGESVLGKITMIGRKMVDMADSALDK